MIIFSCKTCATWYKIWLTLCLHFISDNLRPPTGQEIIILANSAVVINNFLYLLILTMVTNHKLSTNLKCDHQTPDAYILRDVWCIKTLFVVYFLSLSYVLCMWFTCSLTVVHCCSLIVWHCCSCTVVHWLWQS